MERRLRLDIHPPTHGWVTVQLSAPGIEVHFTASYIPRDSIADLAQTASELAKGLQPRNVIWNTEPEEYEFRFEAIEGATQLVVRRFPDHRRGTPSVPIAIVNSDAKTLALAFWRALRRLQGAITPGEFATAWCHPFPTQIVERLGLELGAMAE